MLLEKLQEHKNFTAHEKDVAEYILSHLDQISELSAGELAKASYTSRVGYRVHFQRNSSDEKRTADR